jgi:hypothetical protein
VFVKKASPSHRRNYSEGAFEEGARAVKRNKDKTMLYAADDMSSQEYMQNFHRMRHLTHDDARVEWLAWLVVLGLFITAILGTGCTYGVLF